MGCDASLPVVALGSHIDSVPSGGRYDGVLGVLAGIATVRRLRLAGRECKYPIEVIAFSNEEGCRYPGLFGSSVMMGSFLLPDGGIESLVDSEGINLTSALSSVGGRPNELQKAFRRPEEFKAFLELHIEQGAVLEFFNKTIGIVEEIAAPVRLKLDIFGQANHAGATPMPIRRDALAAASELVLEMERLANSSIPTCVGTVGYLNVKPGVVNVIPGEVSMEFDVRDVNAEARDIVLFKLQAKIREVCDERKLTFALQETFRSEPVALDPDLPRLVEKVCLNYEIPHRRMVSGAAHDAMIIANSVPTAMIFVPSVGGFSHNSLEYTRDEDVLAGVRVLSEVVWRLVKSCSGGGHSN